MSNASANEELGVSEADFVERYGAVEVKLGEFTVPLTVALEMESTFCPAEQTTRENPSARLAYLAGMVDAAGELHPVHTHLLPPKPESIK